MKHSKYSKCLKGLTTIDKSKNHLAYEGESDRERNTHTHEYYQEVDLN